MKKIHGLIIKYDPDRHPFLKYAVKLDVGAKSYADMLYSPRSIAMRGILSLLFVWLSLWFRPSLRPEKT